MNKFHDMIGLLSAADPEFSQIIAVDANFTLFTRAWCVAELAKAFEMGMRQHLKLLNLWSLETNARHLRSLHVGVGH